MEAYAPPSDGNDPTAYVAAIDATTTGLVNLASGGSATTPSSNQSLGSSCANGSAACTTSTGSQTIGTAAILCEAEKYKGVYYLWGGGHSGYSNFRSGCPEASIPSAALASTVSGVGPCATDCSGLVGVAVDAVYNQTFSWAVSTTDGTMTGSGSDHWVSIPISQAQPGDIVTHYGNGDGHVEIVDHVSSNTLYSFGSFETGLQTGSDISSISGGFWNGGAWHYNPGGGQ